MVSVQAVLRRVAALPLERHGFKYAGKMDSASWRFSRRIGEVDQYIDFVRSLHQERSIRVEFSTSVESVPFPGSAFVTGHHLAGGWWTYADDRSLEEVVSELTTLTEERGIPYLAVLSRPIAKPSAETAIHLLDNHALLSEKMQRRLGVSYSEARAPAALEAFLESVEVSLSTPDWGLLCEAAAYLGEVIVTTLGGHWTWDSYLLTPAVARVGGRPNINIHVLIWVATYWCRRDPRNGLVIGFQSYRSMLGI